MLSDALPAGQPGAAAPELSLNPTSMAGESSLGMESRKVQRKLREAQWASFRASRPAEEVDHPDDVAAIAESERTVGDYMLKTDAEYVMDEVRVPGGCNLAITALGLMLRALGL